MTQSTDDRRLDLPGGYYIRRGKPDDMAWSLHMADDLYIGNLRSEYASDFAAAMAALPAPHAPKEEPPAPVDLAAKIRALMADAIEHGRKLWLANEWEQFGLFEQQIAALQECLERVEAALPAPHVPKQEPAAPAKDTP